MSRADLDHRHRHRPAAVLDVAQAGEVVGGEILHRHHPVQHRGDAEEGRDLLLLDQFQRLARLEIHQHQRAAVCHVVHRQPDRDVEHLPGQHVDVGGHDALGNRLVQHAHVDAAVRMQRSLRFTGGAAGVEDQQRIVVADAVRARGLRIAGACQQILVGTVRGGTELEPVRHVHQGLQRIALGAEIRRRQHCRGFALEHDAGHLGHREPPVQRLRDQAGTAAGVEQLEILDAVLRENRDPRPLPHAAERRQAVREPAHARIELAEADAPPVRHVDDRGAPRPEGGVLGGNLPYVHVDAGINTADRVLCCARRAASVRPGAPRDRGRAPC